MRSCREATALALAAMDRRLSMGERIKLTLHRLLCAPCRLYKKQLALMRQCATELRDGRESATTGIDPAARERIRARLQTPSSE